MSNKRTNFRLLRHRFIAVAHDIIMIPLAWLGAFWLRFNLETIPPRFYESAMLTLPLIMVLQLSLFWHFGLYRGVWRFASVNDLLRIIKSVLACVAIASMTLFLFNRMADIPRSAFVLFAILLVLLLGGPRLIYRYLKDRRFNYRTGKRVLIVGCGDAAELLVRDLESRNQRMFQPVAFVDDNPMKVGREIHGIRVMGTIVDIPRLTSELAIEQILIAVPSASAALMQRIVNVCEQSQIPFRTLPRLQDLASGHVTLNELREVSIEDLLGRDPVVLNWTQIQQGINGKRVLVTGGGGSIGSELCRQIANLNPELLIILDNNEFNLYKIDLELRPLGAGSSIVTLLANICDKENIQHIFVNYRPQIVYHTAAYKHVPLLEKQPVEAFKNNVIGTLIIANAAMSVICEAFVLVSTDKVVNPTNIMGASKRVAEILCQNLGAESKTRFMTVRFGNVLGSTGSVVPLFRKQIAAGGPLTVTHPEMQRYFMTIPEAAQLILQATMLGAGGEIFVLKMGDSINIKYLAEQMIILSGKRPYIDINILFTGLRDGEKLYEELLHEDEEVRETSHNQIMLAQSRKVDRALIEESLTEISKCCPSGDVNELFRVIKQLVPEYQCVSNSESTQYISTNGATEERE